MRCCLELNRNGANVARRGVEAQGAERRLVKERGKQPPNRAPPCRKRANRLHIPRKVGRVARALAKHETTRLPARQRQLGIPKPLNQSGRFIDFAKRSMRLQRCTLRCWRSNSPKLLIRVGFCYSRVRMRSCKGSATFSAVRWSGGVSSSPTASIYSKQRTTCSRTNHIRRRWHHKRLRRSPKRCYR